MRCCRTSTSRKLSKKPMLPNGQTSGSERTNRNTASPSSPSGQCRAQRTPPRCSRPASPIPSTNRPDQWWLYSLHATSFALRSGRSPPPGTNAAAAVVRVRAASASSLACSAGSASASWSGDTRRGSAGVLRSTTSDHVTRSCTRSTAGGTEVRDAAAKNRLNPTPISTSANRRRRKTGVVGSRRSRSTTRKLPRPSSSRTTNITAFAPTITPYAVPYSASGVPTYSTLNTAADTRMQPTPAMLIRLNRAPTRRSACPSRSRPSAMTKNGMPPTQIAAPSICSAAAASSRAL